MLPVTPKHKNTVDPLGVHLLPPHVARDYRRLIRQAAVGVPCQRDPAAWTADNPLQRTIDACRPCPIRRACADYALADPTVGGVWGGTTEKSRVTERAARRLNNPKQPADIQKLGGR